MLRDSNKTVSDETGLIHSGLLETPESEIKVTMGLSLLIAAICLLLNKQEFIEIKEAKITHFIIIGLLLGYISGLTGVGGAIYLSPIIYFMKWANMHKNAAISGAFVLVNSLAGLTGYLTNNLQIPSQSMIFVSIAVIGRLVGTYFRVNKFRFQIMKKLLAFVLTIAGWKLIINAI